MPRFFVKNEQIKGTTIEILGEDGKLNKKDFIIALFNSLKKFIHALHNASS